MFGLSAFLVLYHFCEMDRSFSLRLYALLLPLWTPSSDPEGTAGPVCGFVFKTKTYLCRFSLLNWGFSGRRRPSYPNKELWGLCMHVPEGRSNNTSLLYFS